MSSSNRVTVLLVVVLAVALGAGFSCSSDEGGVASNPPGVGGSGAAGSGGADASSTGGTGAGGAPTTFTDFPKDPIVVDSGLPSDLPTQFASPGQPSGGPCLFEPSLGALVPRNWTPLVFEWTPAPDQNVFELRLSVQNQVNDLVVYTSQSSYAMDAGMWSGLTKNSGGQDIQVTLRGGKLDGGTLSAGPATGAAGTLHLAPVAAPGSVVYWTSGPPSSGATALKGFAIGDTKVTTVLTPAIVGGDTNCVACHASSPDGAYTFYVRDGTAGTRSVDVRSVDGKGTGPAAVDVSPTALQLLARHKQSAPALSAAHYSASDAVALSVFHDATLTSGKSELVWTDLHAADANSGWGIVARNGDPRQVASPTWWHDGSTIAYTSAPVSGEGVVTRITDADPTMDIYTVPYNAKAGGSATPLSGASDANYWEYYPVISPGDSLLAFNRCAPRKETSGEWADSYNEPTGEVYVVPAKGGAATRLAANDPPACSGKVSPGLTNSWPRWAPTAEQSGGKNYYWVVFSSIRRADANPQLFISGIVTDASGAIEATYPALYVTAQVASENNHTPAWDFFQVVPR
ncbi:MAG: hypothetical protein R3B13_11915 [Polyangiaceae bacterium]